MVSRKSKKNTGKEGFAPGEPSASEQLDARAEAVRQEAGSDAECHRAVAERAYELYQDRGGEDGRALDDWLRAEIELSGRKGP